MRRGSATPKSYVAEAMQDQRLSAKGGFAPILILIIVAVSIIAAIIYPQIKPKTQPQPISTTSATPSPSATPSDQAKTDETVYTEAPRSANWKTYTDSQYGYSFKYPFDAKVTTQTVYSMLSSIPSNGITVEPPYQKPYSKWYSFALVGRDNPQSLDASTIIDTYIEDIRKSCSPPACGTPKMILDTLKQYRNADIDGYIFHIGAETDSVMVVQVKNGRTYIFRMTGDQGNVTDYGVIVFNQILSTLQFIDKN